MATTNKGIDYGLGKTNIDENGIRYGVIHQNEVLQAWADESEPVYGIIECNKCKHEFNLDKEHFTCPGCKNDDFDMVETETFQFKDKDYSAFQDGYGDIMILKAPYFTYAQFCSPCAPGAVYLMSYLEPINNCPAPIDKCGQPLENNKGYCFGHDWFDEGKAPYPVYDIETGKRVAADSSLMD